MMHLRTEAFASKLSRAISHLTPAKAGGIWLSCLNLTRSQRNQPLPKVCCLGQNDDGYNRDANLARAVEYSASYQNTSISQDQFLQICPEKIQLGSNNNIFHFSCTDRLWLWCGFLGELQKQDLEVLPSRELNAQNYWLSTWKMLDCISPQLS